MGFWLILLPWMFISSYTAIYFFVKIFFFLNVYILVNTIFESSYLFFGQETDHPLSTWGMEGGWEVIRNVYRCALGERGRRRVSLFMSLSYGVLFYCFICRNLTLPSSKKSVFFRIVIFLQWDQFLLPWNKIFLF